jgi:hypothetical protein
MSNDLKEFKNLEKTKEFAERNYWQLKTLAESK